MSSTTPPAADKPEWTWDIARLFPPQGQWSEGSYLSFTESLNQLVEVVDGRVEVLEIPTKSHQKIVQYLLQLVLAFLSDRRLGDAISAPYRIRLRDQTFREPDIVVYLNEHLSQFGERYGEGADLVMEVVSGDSASRVRDYEDKRRDYSQAGITEYWIVDPDQSKIVVMKLEGSDYTTLGEFAVGDEAVSELLSGFRVDVGQTLCPSTSAG
ncbi:MAG: Uma2 family endonuclease [Pirellulaceae bacterium]|nr:Uma2 family endonuclease [Planctomycetales bacterium]MCA9265573.1 Uma2 family endonuclease [Planctomycetales bacterium]